MVLATASTVLQMVTWTISIPSIIINILLALSIRREKSTSNRCRWFNSIFLYSVYSNTLLSILLPLFHPTYIPARNLIYIVYIGPMAKILNKFVMKSLYSVLVGVVTYQACIAPITLVMRWLQVRKKISCVAFYYKTVRSLFLLTSIPLPITMEIWMILLAPSAKLKSISEKSHEESVRRLTGDSYAYFAVEWNFCYLVFIFIAPYLIFFFISLCFYRLYIKSIWNVSSDFIDLGYHYASTINHTLLSMALQNLIFITLPHLCLSVTVVIRWDLGIRALPLSFGCVIVPLTTAVTLFVHFRAYRRQLGFLFIELLRRNSVNIPIFVINNQNNQGQSTQFQVSTV